MPQHSSMMKIVEGKEDGKETDQRLEVGVLGVVASWVFFFLLYFLCYKLSVMLSLHL